MPGMVPTGLFWFFGPHVKKNYVGIGIMCSEIQNEYRRVPGKPKTPSKLHDVVIFVVQEFLVSPFSHLRFLSKEVSESQVCVRRSQDAAIYAETDQ